MINVEKDFFTAAMRCDLNEMEGYIRKGVNVHSKTDAGCSALHLILGSPSPDKIKGIQWLIDLGLDPLQQDFSGKIPLHIAAGSGHMACVEILLEFGGINTPDKKGWTPLFYAGSGLWLEVSQYLVECGAEVGLRDADGRTIYESLSMGISVGRVKTAALADIFGSSKNSKKDLKKIAVLDYFKALEENSVLDGKIKLNESISGLQF